MKFEVFETPQAFYLASQSFLHKHEVTNSLMIGILRRVDKDDYSDDFFCLGKNEGEPVIAIMIQGLHIIIATEYETCLKEAADYVASCHLTYPGVIGPRPYVDLFVDHLKESTEAKLALGMSQRIYRLDQVREIDPVNGFMRLAREDELEMLIDWTLDSGMAMSDDRVKEGKKRLESIKNESLFIWEDAGIPRAMAALSRSVGQGITVSLVYTPGDQRRKGYASNLVAQVSKHALNDYEYCSLYTDLSNPTSNSIYMKIGYKPVVDSAMYLVEQ